MEQLTENKTKKKKIKLKKSVKITLLLILVCLSVLIIKKIFSTHSYSVEYNINYFAVSENYEKENTIYYFEIKDQNHKYNFVTEIKYQKDKKLINNIEKYTEEEYTCLVIESSYFETNPLCSHNEENIDYRLIPDSLELPINNKIEEYETNYENYKIFNTDNKILVWTYKGFIYFNKDKVEEIKIFNKDIYDISLATKINNYIVIPNYEQNYSFNKLYIINLDNQKVEEWNINYDISFDSYIVGTNNKSIFLVDRKNKIEYELVPHKQKMRIIASNKKQGIIYENGEEKNITLNKLVTSTQKFTYKNNYKYTLDNNTLYLSYLDNQIKTKVSELNISSIVTIDNDDIYYLSNNILYKYNLYYGETKLIEHSDWQFNYLNLIFLNN